MAEDHTVSLLSARNKKVRLTFKSGQTKELWKNMMRSDEYQSRSPLLSSKIKDVLRVKGRPAQY